MELFTENGALDHDVARRRLSAAPQITNEKLLRTEILTIQTAALLDIAGSLSVIALEAAEAMNLEGIVSAMAGDETLGTTSETGGDFLVVGDLVNFKGETDPLEVTTLGFSEGEGTATVIGPDGAGGVFFVKDLEHWRGEPVPPEVVENAVELAETASELLEPRTIDEIVEIENEVGPLQGVATAAETPAVILDDDGDGEPAVGGYELDDSLGDILRDDQATVEALEEGDVEDDFDEPVNAAEALAAAEAAKKARKKGKR